MIRNKDILSCLPLLASVLGRSYGVQVRIGGNSAYTKGNEIHIPSLPIDCATDTLALARGYIDHESAHIRFTDFEVLRAARLDAVTHHIWNSIEDWRVEGKLSLLYPGCRRHFQWLARRVFVEEADKREEEAGVNPASSILEYVLLSVRSWAVPEIHDPLQMVIKKMDAHFQGLRSQIDAVLTRIRNRCRSTEESIGYACEIAELMKQWKPEKQPLQCPDGRGLMYPSGERKSNHIEESSLKENQEDQDSKQQVAQGILTCPSRESSCEEETQQICGDISQNTENQCKEEENVCTAAQRSLLGDHQEATEVNEQWSKEMQGIADLFKQDSHELPKGFSEALTEALTAQHAGKRHNELAVATVGRGKMCNVTQEEKEQALQVSAGLRARLQGLLQAQIRQEVGVGRRGRLCPAKLYRLQIGNPLLFRKVEEKGGLNTAVHILMDVSGSMRGQSIIMARQACFALAKGMAEIKGLNVAVTAFPALESEDSVYPVMQHGARAVLYPNVDTYGSTPLAAALWWVVQVMLSLKENRKLILLVTDGQPDNLPTAEFAVKSAQKAGFEVYGIGIREPSITRLLPHTSHCIQALSELTPTVFSVLQSALLQKDRR